MTPACLDSSAWIEIAHKGHNAQTFLKAAGDMSNVIVSFKQGATVRYRRDILRRRKRRCPGVTGWRAR